MANPLDQFSDLKEWMTRDIARYSNLDHHAIIHFASNHLKVQIFTDNNEYSISARRDQTDQGYIGCSSKCRKARAGEDHRRGSDLADGPYNEQTWRRILADIVSYELVRIHVPKQPQADIPMPGPSNMPPSAEIRA
jgi:hypothetical protein